MEKTGIVIHGGVSQVEGNTPQMKSALESAVNAGYDVLARKGPAVDAVEAAIRILEDQPYFNAGRGSAFTEIGTIEMHAAIMDGGTALFGAASAVRLVKNPISLAKAIMLNAKNSFLCAEGAEKFARMIGIEKEAVAYFVTQAQYELWQKVKEEERQSHNKIKKHGTVGAVAMDYLGNMAAGTSTGGSMNAMSDRISDSAIVGAGTYANHLCGISCTGEGDFFTKTAAGRTIACLMEFNKMTLAQACRYMMNEIKKYKGDAGIIAMDARGNIEIVTNTGIIFSAYRKHNELPVIKVEKNEHG